MRTGAVRARRAQSDDAGELRRFRCDRGGWFAADVQRLIRGRVASAVASDDPEVIIFELGNEPVAVAVMEVDETTPSICDLHVVAIANAHQGTRTETAAGDLPLGQVVLDTAMARAAELGATRARTIVARDNARSLRMLSLAGFTRLGRFDKDYDEYAAPLR